MFLLLSIVNILLLKIISRSSDNLLTEAALLLPGTRLTVSTSRIQFSRTLQIKDNVGGRPQHACDLRLRWL